MVNIVLTTNLCLPRKGGERAKRLLDPLAVDTMNQWYQEHLDYPYPTDQEKRVMADSTGITVSQVRGDCFRLSEL